MRELQRQSIDSRDHPTIWSSASDTEVFTAPVVETIDVSPFVRQNVSFDVMSGFVSCIYDDVPTVSSMYMS